MVKVQAVSLVFLLPVKYTYTIFVYSVLSQVLWKKKQVTCNVSELNKLITVEYEPLDEFLIGGIG